MCPEPNGGTFRALEVAVKSKSGLPPGSGSPNHGRVTRTVPHPAVAAAHTTSASIRGRSIRSGRGSATPPCGQPVAASRFVDSAGTSVILTGPNILSRAIAKPSRSRRSGHSVDAANEATEGASFDSRVSFRLWTRPGSCAWLAKARCPLRPIAGFS
jgi:hypothetical protein